jgi:hypothetical protein
MDKKEETKSDESFIHNTAVLIDEKRINPEGESLTPEKLITFEGLEGLTEKEAEEIIFSLNTYCSIIYDFLMQDYTTENITPQNKAA